MIYFFFNITGLSNKNKKNSPQAFFSFSLFFFKQFETCTHYWLSDNFQDNIPKVLIGEINMAAPKVFTVQF